MDKCSFKQCFSGGRGEENGNIFSRLQKPAKSHKNHENFYGHLLIYVQECATCTYHFIPLLINPVDFWYLMFALICFTSKYFYPNVVNIHIFNNSINSRIYSLFYFRLYNPVSTHFSIDSRNYFKYWWNHAQFWSRYEYYSRIWPNISAKNMSFSAPTLLKINFIQ